MFPDQVDCSRCLEKFS